MGWDSMDGRVIHGDSMPELDDGMVASGGADAAGSIPSISVLDK